MDRPTAPGLAPPVSPRGPEVAGRRRFAVRPASVREARRFVRGLLPTCAADRADEVVLMVSELATNAVRHAAADYEVAVVVEPDAGRVRVEVSDAAHGYPVPPELVDDAPHGRGLHIVGALADAWGIEIRRDRPGKTVWFDALVAGARTDGAPTDPRRTGARARDEESAGVTAHAMPTAGVEEQAEAQAKAQAQAQAQALPWPVHGVRAVLDGLLDATVATDEHGTIRYANAAAEDLLGWSAGSLAGRPARDLVRASGAGPLDGRFQGFVWKHADDVRGRRLSAVVTSEDGTEVDTDLVLSMVEHPFAGRVVVGIFRSLEDRKLQRWSELTTELLEILAEPPIDDPPAERLLSTLGRRLEWDVTTMWALSPAGELVCRHVWTRTPSIAAAFSEEKAADPTSGSEGLPRWVSAHNEALWVPDLSRDARFMTDALASDGLQNAYAFPIRYRGACVGIVKMLSRTPRERDPAVVELMDAVGGQLGELLNASAEAAEREMLVDELLEARRRNEFLSWLPRCSPRSSTTARWSSAWPRCPCPSSPTCA